MSILCSLFTLVTLGQAQMTKPTITSITPTRQVAGGDFEVTIEVPLEYRDELKLRFYRAEGRKPDGIQQDVANITDGGALDLEDTPGLIRCRIKTNDRWLRPPPRQYEDRTFLVVLLVLPSRPSGEPVTNLREAMPVSVGPPVLAVDNAKLLNYQIERLSQRVGAVQHIEEDKTRQDQLRGEIVALKGDHSDQAVITFDGLVIHKNVVVGASDEELVTKTLSAEVDAAKSEAERTKEALEAVEDPAEKKGLLSKLTKVIEDIALLGRRVK